MKHNNIIYGLAAILILSLISGCDENSNSIPNATSQVQTDIAESTNSIPDTEIEAQKKKDSESIQLSADPGVDEILLKWEAVKKTTEYMLEWGLSQDDMVETLILDAEKTQFLHTQLEPATAYYYRITAKLEKKKEEVSAVLEVHTGDRKNIKQSDVAY